MFALAITVAIILRLWLILCNRHIREYWRGGSAADAAAYMLLVQFYRQRTRGYPDPRCLITNEGIYAPNLYEKTIGVLFSDSTLNKFPWLPNFIIYVLFVLVFLLISNYSLGQNNQYAVFFSLIILMVKSDNLLFDYNRIHYLSLQPRYLGLVLCSIFWGIFSLLELSNSYILLMILLSVLIWNVSKFSVQALVLPSFIIAVIFSEYIPIYIIIISFFVNALIFREKFLIGIKLHLKYLLWQIRREFADSKKDGKFKKIILKILAPQVRGIFSYPDFIFVLLIIFHFKNEIIPERVKELYIAILVLFILTSFRKFSFIGESWRYISFCTYLTSPIVIAIFLSKISFEYFYFFILIVLFYLVSKINSGNYIVNNNQSLIKLLNENRDKLINSNWFSIPYFSALPIVTNNFGKKCLYFQTGNWTEKILNKYFSIYPFLTYTSDVIRSHGITHILIEKEYINTCPPTSLPNFQEIELICENEHFSIYKTNF